MKQNMSSYNYQQFPSIRQVSALENMWVAIKVMTGQNICLISSLFPRKSSVFKITEWGGN